MPMNAQPLEFRHLRCFSALAEELHFGRAAARLAMTQPPLSMTIRQLEDLVGTSLFERNSRGVRLTAAGDAFRAHARALLAGAEEACIAAREVGAGATGRIKVGMVGMLLYRGLPRWLQQFGREHPRIEVALVELNSQQQLEALARGELDVAFVLGRRIPEGFEQRTVFTEPFVACLPATHPASRRRSLALPDLRDESFVLFSRSASPDYHAQILEMCAAAGFYPRVRHELRHWLSVVALVSQGLGVAVVPAALRRSALAGAVFRPLAGSTAVSELRCVWRGDAPVSAALAAFLQVVKATEAAPAPAAIARPKASRNAFSRGSSSR